MNAKIQLVTEQSELNALCSLLADSLAAPSAGSRIAISSAIMEMTTSSSMSVNALERRCFTGWQVMGIANSIREGRDGPMRQSKAKRPPPAHAGAGLKEEARLG